jgi:phosphatidylcholine synthase
VTRQLVAAFSVHIFTATGAALGFLALIAAVRAQWTEMFIWLGIALVIDGVDGTIARRVNVAKLLPRWSGDALDLVIDFVTYVFVPAYAMATSGLLPDLAAIPLGVAVIMTGAIYFSDRDMKTSDYYFRGFPALWNIAAFYLFILKPAPWTGALAVAVLAALTFAPIYFIHPIRVPRLRIVNVAALAAWTVLALVAVMKNLDPGTWVVTALAALAVYFLAVGFWRPSR